MNVTLLTLSPQVSPYYKQNQNTAVRRLNVIAAHAANNSIEAMFGGAYSGIYSVDIRHKTFGLIDTSALRFTVGSEYSAITPQVGSIYGGTLITITGTNWSTDKRDNPVSIVYNGALGATICNVITTSVNKITCRIGSFSAGYERPNDDEGKLVVFLKTSEEATCSMADNCKFKYTSAIPQVTSMTPEWDVASNTWSIKLLGTAFTGALDSVELSVLGKVQTPEVVSSTLA